MENYFNYFTEIEEHFQKRRGSGLLLSTLDWALIETWKDAGIPLEAVLRGIEAAFERYEQRPSKTRKVNSLAYCAQEVLAASEDMKEAAVGATRSQIEGASGFGPAEIAAFLRRNATALESAQLPQGGAISAMPVAIEAARSLRELASGIESKAQPGSQDPPPGDQGVEERGNEHLRLEDLERRLTVLEEKLFAVLLAATPDEQILAVRAEADRDLAPYRRKVPAAQIEQLHKQYVHKRLLERYSLPRLSLFYM